MARLQDQLGKVAAHSNSVLSHRFDRNESDTAKRENQTDHFGVPNSYLERDGIHEGVSEVDWEDVSKNAGSAPSTTCLQALKELSICPVPIIQNDGEKQRQGVNADHQSMERSPNPFADTRPHYRNGCVAPRLEGSIRGAEYWWLLVREGEKTPHQGLGIGRWRVLCVLLVWLVLGE